MNLISVLDDTDADLIKGDPIDGYNDSGYRSNDINYSSQTSQ